VWKMLPSCLLWCQWRERNDPIFEECERMLEELKSSFFYSLYIWTAVFVAPLEISFNDFLGSFFSF
jgi:hypothetical protein